MKILNYIKLLQKYNTLKLEHEALENNFKNSAYKRVLDYEGQMRYIEFLEEETKRLKELNADIKKEKRLRATVQRLKKGDIEE